MADGRAPTNNHCLEMAWARSSRCQEATNCVEISSAAEVTVRDSKDPSPVIVFDPGAWQQFVRWIG